MCQNKYPPGEALFRLPVMAFLVDTGPGRPVVSDAEQRASLYLSAFTLLLVCIVMTATCRLLRLSVACTHLAVLAMVFGTGLFHYGTYDGSFSHVYSALAVALLIWLGVRTRIAGAGWLARLATGFTAFLLVATRFTNVIAIAILVLGYLVWDRARWRDAVPVLLGVAAAAGLQFGYNFYATGHLAISSYGGEGFRFDQPEQRQVLFSYQRGLFTWYPVIGVALLAGLFVRVTRRAALWLAVGIAAFATLYGFWSAGSLGGFGNRGFVELVPAATVLFAAALTELHSRWRAAVALAAVVSSFLTVELMSGYWRNAIPYSAATEEIYWSHVMGKDSWVR